MSYFFWEHLFSDTWDIYEHCGVFRYKYKYKEKQCIPILIPPSSTTLKVLDVLKLISGIWNKLLKIKLVMETIWGGIVEPNRFDPDVSE